MKKFLALIALIFLLPVQVFANLRIAEILPKPEKWDEEFIVLQNNSCEKVDLSDYFLTIRGKKLSLKSAEIWPQESIKIDKSQYSFLLRDGGDTILLHKNSGEKIDEIAYTDDEVEEGKILTFEIENESCEEEKDEENNSDNNEKGGDESDNEDENSDGNEQKDEENGGDAEKEEDKNNDKNTDSEEENNENADEETQNEEEFVVADELEYGDEDGDGKFDFIKISYSESLTGSIDISKIFLTSASGGLFESPVIKDNLKIFSGAISENILTFYFTGAVIKNEKLTIDDTENSHLLLFSEEFFGISGLNGKKVENFSEKSFENYTKIIHPEFEKNDEDPGETSETNDNETDKKWDDFPKVIPKIQRSTTANLSENTLFCSEKPCKINLDFTHIFDKNFPLKDFSCRTLVENHIYEGCNPPQLSLENEAELTFIVTKKSDNSEFITHFSVDFSKIPASNISESKNNNPRPRAQSRTQNIKYSTPPIIQIASEGKYEKMYKWLDDENIECFSPKCSINLTASGTYSEEGMSLKYVWKFGKNIEQSKKNPTTVTLETGEHIISLLVTDSNGVSAIREISVFVPENAVEMEEKAEKKSREKPFMMVFEDEKNQKKTKNDITEENFTPPEIILQNPANFSISENIYTCRTKWKTCSVNFSLTGAINGVKYIWNWSDGEEFISKNPRGKSLPIGTHSLKIVALDENSENIFWEENLVIKVQKIVTPKKPKTTKPKTEKAKKTDEKTDEKEEIVKNEEEIIIEKNWTPKEQIPLSAAGIIFSGLLFSRLRKGKKLENLEENKIEKTEK